MRIKSTMLLFFLLLTRGTLLAQPDLKMHRLQDTTKNSSGWYFAKSTEGHFSVLLPIPFNDFTVLAKNSTESVSAFAVGGISEEGIKFSVTELPYIKKKEDVVLKDILDKFKTADGTISEVKEFSFSTYPAISFKKSDSKNGAYTRYIKTNKGLINMIIEFPLETSDTVNELSESFFESLKIE